MLAAAVLAVALTGAGLRAEMAFAGLDGPGEAIGWIAVTEDRDGRRVEAHLHDVRRTGSYALEVRMGTSCEPTLESRSDPETMPPMAAVAAGQSGQVMGARGHEARASLKVRTGGVASEVRPAPRLPTLDKLKGHALVLFGPGGEPLYCGVLR